MEVKIESEAVLVIIVLIVMLVVIGLPMLGEIIERRRDRRWTRR